MARRPAPDRDDGHGVRAVEPQLPLTTGTGMLLARAEIALIVAWKNGGYVAVDAYLLPLLGTPWRRGHGAGPGLAPMGAAGQPLC